MKFEYFTFSVTDYLERQEQPVFVWEPEQPRAVPRPVYHTLVDASNWEFAVCDKPGSLIRIPVFAFSSSTPNKDVSEHAALFAMGFEVATQALLHVPFSSNVFNAVIVLGEECHLVSEGRYRAYIGVTFERKRND